VSGLVDAAVDRVVQVAQEAVKPVTLAAQGDYSGAAAAAGERILMANPIVMVNVGAYNLLRDVSEVPEQVEAAVNSPNDYEAGRRALDPVVTTMEVTATVLAPKVDARPSAPRSAPEPAPQGKPPTSNSKLTDSQLQAIADDAHAALESDIASKNRSTTINEHASGHLSSTGSQKPNPAQREVLTKHGVEDVPVHGQQTKGEGPTGHHAEQRGIAHGKNINDPVVRQATSSGAQHGGKACPDCDRVQQENHVHNATGKQ
jgi:hypothetical protein